MPSKYPRELDALYRAQLLDAALAGVRLCAGRRKLIRGLRRRYGPVIARKALGGIVDYMIKHPGYVVSERAPLSSLLDIAMEWGATTEGHQFWRNIHSELVARER